MPGSETFNKALSSFTSEVAYKSAVRHLYDLGFTPPEIVKKVDYPVSEEKVRQVIDDYIEEKKKEASSGASYEFVERYDNLGRKSLIKVKKKQAT